MTTPLPRSPLPPPPLISSTTHSTQTTQIAAPFACRAPTPSQPFVSCFIGLETTPYAVQSAAQAPRLPPSISASCPSTSGSAWAVVYASLNNGTDLKTYARTRSSHASYRTPTLESSASSTRVTPSNTTSACRASLCKIRSFGARHQINSFEITDMTRATKLDCIHCNRRRHQDIPPQCPISRHHTGRRLWRSLHAFSALPVVHRASTGVNLHHCVDMSGSLLCRCNPAGGMCAM